ncbi:hypothetical protein D3C87_1109380 [compost metagenome]
MVDCFDRRENMRIVRRAQAEANKGKRIGTDDVAGRQRGTVRRLVADGRIAEWSSYVGRVRRSDANIVAGNAKRGAECLVTGKGPLFDLLVPAISRFP